MDEFKYDYQRPVIRDNQSTRGNAFCFWDTVLAGELVGGCPEPTFISDFQEWEK